MVSISTSSKARPKFGALWRLHARGINAKPSPQPVSTVAVPNDDAISTMSAINLFGQSKYYVASLSENVRRGTAQNRNEAGCQVALRSATFLLTV